jgi:hypothetical protein
MLNALQFSSQSLWFSLSHFHCKFPGAFACTMLNLTGHYEKDSCSIVPMSLCSTVLIKTVTHWRHSCQLLSYRNTSPQGHSHLFINSQCGVHTTTESLNSTFVRVHHSCYKTHGCVFQPHHLGSWVPSCSIFSIVRKLRSGEVSICKATHLVRSKLKIQNYVCEVPNPISASLFSCKLSPNPST